MVLWRRTRTSRANTEKDVLLIIGDWNAKVGHQEIPGVTGRLGLRVQNDVRQRLAVFPREWTGHSKHPLSIAQEMTPHERHQIVNTKIRLIIFFAAKDGEALYSQQNQDQELTVTQLMNSLLPNSDLNWRTIKFLTLYTVEVTNRFKGLDLIDKEYQNYGQRFVTLYRRQWLRPSPRKRNAKRQNGWRGLTNSWEKREAKGKGEKERYTHLNAEFQRIKRKDKKAFLSDLCKEIQENNKKGKTRDLF